MRRREDDPLSAFTKPPRNETPAQRAQRLAKEEQAKKISDAIDENLKAEKIALRKQKYIVRVLLLGQSGSGKSTTLKNFRLRYARDAWEAERASWKAVVQLNVVRSILSILAALEAEIEGQPLPDNAHQPLSQIESGNDAELVKTSSVQITPTVSHQYRKNSLLCRLNGKHDLLRLRLAPLRSVEVDLRNRLGESGDDPFVRVPLRPGSEFCVRRLDEALEKSQHWLGESSVCSGRATPVDETTEVLAGCKEDMKALWADEAVRLVLRKRQIALDDLAGFYLDDLDRITHVDYEPADDDVIRARLRTLAVQEYQIKFHQGGSLFPRGVGGDFGKEWLLYDVGGSRTLRHAWIPFFDSAQAIIFLAPTSCFDERLSEDSSVNRLEDSFLLWRSICSSKLLARAAMILFLNKCDLLKKKLKLGVMVKTFLPSYRERPNEFATVLKYFGEKFKEILKQHASQPRASYFYATSVIDTKATASTIDAVQDSILKDYLKNAELV